MLEKKQFSGRTVAEAAIKACDALGLTRSDLKYDIVSDTGEKLERKVVIEVEASAAPQVRTEAQPYVPGQPEPGPKGHRESRESRHQDDHRPHQRRSRDRADHFPSSDRRRSNESRYDRHPGHDSRRRDDRRSAPRRDDAGIDALLDLESVQIQNIERPEIATEASSKAAKARDMLKDVVRLMHLSADVRLVHDDAEEIQIDISGTDAPKLIGKRGEVLLSLQFLINRMVGRDTENEQLILLDAMGYRERRKEALAQLARKLAERAIEERKAVRLTPMSAHDRRIFHVTLKDVAGVTTRSEGEGIFRQLLIVPAI